MPPNMRVSWRSSGSASRDRTPPIGGRVWTRGTAPAIGTNAPESAPVRRPDRTHTDIHRPTERLGFGRPNHSFGCGKSTLRAAFRVQYDARRPLVAALPPHTRSPSPSAGQGGFAYALTKSPPWFVIDTAHKRSGGNARQIANLLCT